MKVNVILITYNHSHYIRQTLESILMQRTDCEVEIIVADDASTDDTVSVIKEYSERSLFSFTFLPKETNLGFVKNYQRAFKACKGDYIAILEGDDYWTSPYHIEKHVSFLDEHRECTMSYNRHVRYWVDENRFEVFEWDDNENYKYITSQRLVLENCIGNFSCCMFRGQLIRELKPELFDLNFADWLMGIIMGQYGFLAYQKEITSAYRIHNKGQWSHMSGEEQAKKIIEMIEVYDAFLDYKYTKEFTKHKQRLEICLYGDKSVKGNIKKMTPEFIRKAYRNIFR